MLAIPGGEAAQGELMMPIWPPQMTRRSETYRTRTIYVAILGVEGEYQATPIVCALGDPPHAKSARRLRLEKTFSTRTEAKDTTGKRLELLKELVPLASPMAVLWANLTANNPRYWRAAEAAARKQERKLVRLEIRDAGEIERAFKTASRAHVGAVPRHRVEPPLQSSAQGR